MDNEQTEIEKLEAEMKKLNVDIVRKDSLKNEGGVLFVEVDIDCEINLDFMAEHCMIKKVMRGSVYYVVFDDKTKDKLTMRIGVELPKDYMNIYGNSLNTLRQIATTFPDLCWIHSEGTTPNTLNEVETKLRPDSVMGDLTWVLPSKFVDDFVEMMHTLNQSIISGLMQDAIVYGPYVS